MERESIKKEENNLQKIFTTFGNLILNPISKYLNEKRSRNMPLVFNDIWKPLIKVQLNKLHCDYHRTEYGMNTMYILTQYS